MLFMGFRHTTPTPPKPAVMTMSKVEAETDSDADRLWMYEVDLCNVIEVDRETDAKGKVEDIKRRCLTHLREGDKLMQKTGGEEN